MKKWDTLLKDWDVLISSYGFKGEDKKVLTDFFSKQEYIKLEANIKKEMLESILNDLKEGNKAQANFRLLSKKIMDDYVRRGNWSRFDLIAKQALEGLGLRGRQDWFHNFKIQTPEQNSIFELDFFLPDYVLDIENDGDVWHKIGDAERKDIRRDAWLKRLGIRTLRLKGENFPNTTDTKKIQKEKIDGLKEKIQKELTFENGGSNIKLVLKAVNPKTQQLIEAKSEIGAKKGKRVSMRIFNAIIEDLKDKILKDIGGIY